MALPAHVLTATLDPIRESTITALLHAQARALDAGADIMAEPIRRDTEGKVARSGELDLPSRGDIAVTMEGRTLIQRVEGRSVPGFEPLEAFIAQDFQAVIGPFRWEDVPVLMSRAAERPNWSPLRLWFLEWFQTRTGGLAPELAGGVHSIEGPKDVLRGWRFHIDLGSAPTDAVIGLLAALSESGCASAEIGDIGD